MAERIHPKIQRQMERKQRTETVINLGLQRVPFREIATAVKYLPSTVRKILRRNDIAITHSPLKEKIELTPEQSEKFLSLYFGNSEKKGISLHSAAVLAGTTESVAERFMKKNNIESKGVGGHGKKNNTI